MGTASLVLGIIGAVFSLIPIIGVIAWPMVIVGLVLGILGYLRAKRGQADNKGVAIAGISLSAVGLFLCIVYTAVFASAVGDASKTTPTASAPTYTAPTYTAQSAAEAVPSEGIGDGTHIIGQDMEPGTYRSTGAKQGLFEFCHWATKSGASSNSDTVDFGTANANEPMVVEIGKNVKAFESSNCEPWIKQ